MKKALITDDCHPALLEGLTRLGYACDYQPDITPEETLDIVKSYHGLIINSKINVNRAFLDRAVALEFVGRLGSGMEIVDRTAAAEKGVAVFSSPEGNRNAVAEQALGMLLALANNLLRADREVRQFTWHREKNRGFELCGKTIGIIGFGHTGSQFARKLSGMEMKVLAFDKYKSAFAADMPWVQEADMHTIFEHADMVSFHLPLTDETRALCNAQFLSKFKKPVIVINTSRGKVVHTADLLEGLENGAVLGACLDVFENEKPQTFNNLEKSLYDRLYLLENVVLSPHVAGWTHESKKLLATILIDKITHWKAQ